MEFKGQTVITQSVAFSSRFRISTISVPVPLRSARDSQFKTIRDFGNAVLSVGVSSNLTAKLKGIDLIVNGWVLFHADTKNASWRQEPDGFILLRDKGDDAHPPHASFGFSIHEETLPFHQNLSGAAILDDAVFTQITRDFDKWEP
jgi:hypothetical protein